MSDTRSLLELGKEYLGFVDQEKMAHANLCMHIRTALSTPSGKILKQWLKANCFMNGTMAVETLDNNAANQRINARRDLFIALTNLEENGVTHVSST